MDLEEAFQVIVSNFTLCLNFSSYTCEEVFRESLEFNIENCFETLTDKENRIPIEKGLYPKDRAKESDEARGMLFNSDPSNNQSNRGASWDGGGSGRQDSLHLLGRTF